MWKLKTVTVDGKEYAVIQDGKPVFVKEDGTETAIDVPATVATISRLNGEAKGHRERAEAAEAKVKAFEGIEDPAAARAALATVANLDAKKLVDAGKVDEIKAAAVKAVEEKYKPIVEERDKLRGELHNEAIGGRFARSKFIADKVAIPSDMVQAAFGSRFKMVDGKVQATDANGNVIYSPSKPGEVADFDEALEVLVNAYPNKDHILKGNGKTGGGANGGLDKGAGAGTMSRKDFDAMAKTDPAGAHKLMSEGKTTIVD